MNVTASALFWMIMDACMLDATTRKNTFRDQHFGREKYHIWSLKPFRDQNMLVASWSLKPRHR